MVSKVIGLPDPYAYPIKKHDRKHGPLGYYNYDSYREWLRDEFSFRCVFCLKRERWGLVTGAWDIDHLVPQSIDSSKKLDYENLLYVCRTCNSVKSDDPVLNPCKISLGNCLKVNGDGTINALNREGEILIEFLRLDNDEHTKFRYLIISTLLTLAEYNKPTFILWMCYPDNLPDLNKLRPPGGNTKPRGVKNCFYERRARGQLAETY